MNAGLSLDAEIDAFVQRALPTAIASGDPSTAVAEVISAMKEREFDPTWTVDAKLTWWFVETLGHMTASETRAAILAATNAVKSHVPHDDSASGSMRPRAKEASTAQPRGTAPRKTEGPLTGRSSRTSPH